MSLMEWRGGFPVVYRRTIDVTGRSIDLKVWTKYLKIRVATNPLKVYFTQADFDNDENWVVVPVAAAATPYGEWSGPVEAKEIWLKGDGGNSTIELVAFQRRT